MFEVTGHKRTKFIALTLLAILQMPLLSADASDLPLNKPDSVKDSVSSTRKTSEGWRQERHNGLGREVLFASDRGVKISYPEAGLDVLSQPPNWDVIWFDRARKQHFVETLTHYRARKNMVDASLPPPALPETPAAFAGLKARKISVRDGGDLTFYYVTEKVSLPQGALVFLSTFFGMPNFGGIPLASQQSMLNGHAINNKPGWYTISSKREKLPDSVFGGPSADSKMVSRVEAVQSDPAKNAKALANRRNLNAAAEEISKQMGIGVPFKK